MDLLIGIIIIIVVVVLINKNKKKEEQEENTPFRMTYTVERVTAKKKKSVFSDDVTINHAKKTFFLDTETTGLSKAKGAELVEISLIDDNGAVLINTLVKPKNPIPKQATAIHHITDDMVQNAPPAKEIIERVYEAVQGGNLVIYNATFDLQWFPDITKHVASVICAMRAFSNHYGDRSYNDTPKFMKLEEAIKIVGYTAPEGMNAHRALADCYACKAVYEHLKNKRLI